VQQFAKVVLTAYKCVIDLTERPAKKCEGAFAFFTKGTVMTTKQARKPAKITAQKTKLTEAQRQRLISALENHLRQESQPRRTRKAA
jgi:hypothetical protein